MSSGNGNVVDMQTFEVKIPNVTISLVVFTEELNTLEWVLTTQVDELMDLSNLRAETGGEGWEETSILTLTNLIENVNDIAIDKDILRHKEFTLPVHIFELDVLVSAMEIQLNNLELDSPDVRIISNLLIRMKPYQYMYQTNIKQFHNYPHNIKMLTLYKLYDLE
ncbi:hypothetical protein [Brevibacillus reuszeri]|uniref:hypothetical protein n=1 Tax=Brevibacillus reuszeri TaxID=54915 RepID=UPI000CCC9193|nr:hypothetical protein [Brevibacillus reuszeri]